jgi:hypothetical protein
MPHRVRKRNHLTVRVTVRPGIPGGFTPTSFRDLLQLPIRHPGLDPLYTQTLIDVSVGPQGNAAELTIQLEPPDALPVDTALRVLSGTPDARVRCVTRDGTELHLGRHPAPLQAGQAVAVGDQDYLVAEVSWPDRDPATGVATGTVDQQLAVLIPTPASALLPVAG